jgi:hypothetical protein
MGVGFGAVFLFVICFFHLVPGIGIRLLSPNHISMNSRRLDGSLGEEILIHILAVLFNDRAGGWSEQHPSWINSSILLAFISMFF